MALKIYRYLHPAHDRSTYDALHSDWHTDECLRFDDAAIFCLCTRNILDACASHHVVKEKRYGNCNRHIIDGVHYTHVFWATFGL